MPGGDAGELREPVVDGAARKHAMPLAIFAAILAADILTKLWAVDALIMHRPVEVLGDFFRLTYTHNPGAAFGIHVGEHSRTVFLVLGAAALVILYLLYRATPAWDRLRLTAIALVAGGALGNMLDRVRYERGVVDFLDVGIGSHRWPVFNVADMAVTTGALLLLLSFYLEGREEKRREAEEARGEPEEARGKAEQARREPEEARPAP